MAAPVARLPSRPRIVIYEHLTGWAASDVVQALIKVSQFTDDLT